MLAPLPPRFPGTRDALHALACYVMAPAYKAATGRIGLRPVGDGFGTQAFADGSRLAVHGDRLRHVPGEGIALTTLRAAALLAGVELSPDPGVGRDLPPFTPDDELAVERKASLALGSWYRFGQRVLDAVTARFAATSEAQLWPEHFDLALVVTLDGDRQVNVGVSPGDAFEPGPYLYVGPHDLAGLDGAYWNAPFGAALPRHALVDSDDALGDALRFVDAGLAAV